MTIRIGFFLTPTTGWLGGINYFKNLFLAISAANDGDTELYVVVPANVDRAALDMMISDCSNINVVRTTLLKRGHPWWLAWRIIRKLFNTELVARMLVRRYRLDVVSHSDFMRGGGARVINWLPDFQHLHLPQMFDTSELESRKSRYADLTSHSDRIVISSEDARCDLVSSMPDVALKARVLSFVSAIPPKYWSLDESDHAKLLERYHLQRGFFFVPNQFWQHKNHRLLLDVIKLAKDQKLQIQFVCSGATNDPRCPPYFKQLQRRAVEIGCGDSLRILGIIPYEDVLSLMRFSCAVVNPSKFEGWSSTVEECKSASKRILLSNIAVHREQMPNASFFDPEKPEELVFLLKQSQASPEVPLSANVTEQMSENKRRFIEYGTRYLTVVHEVCV